MGILKSISDILRNSNLHLVQMHSDIKDIKKMLEPTNSGFIIHSSDVNSLINNSIRSVISDRPTFTNTKEMIKEQIQFDKEYSKRNEENPALVRLIETYILNDKDEDKKVIELYDYLNSKFDIKFKEVKDDHTECKSYKSCKNGCKDKN